MTHTSSLEKPMASLAPWLSAPGWLRLDRAGSWRTRRGQRAPGGGGQLSRPAWLADRARAQLGRDECGAREGADHVDGEGEVDTGHRGGLCRGDRAQRGNAKGDRD